MYPHHPSCLWAGACSQPAVDLAQWKVCLGKPLTAPVLSLSHSVHLLWDHKNAKTNCSCLLVTWRPCKCQTASHGFVFLEWGGRHSILSGRERSAFNQTKTSIVLAQWKVCLGKPPHCTGAVTFTFCTTIRTRRQTVLVFWLPGVPATPNSVPWICLLRLRWPTFHPSRSGTICVQPELVSFPGPPLGDPWKRGREVGSERVWAFHCIGAVSFTLNAPSKR